MIWPLILLGFFCPQRREIFSSKVFWTRQLKSVPQKKCRVASLLRKKINLSRIFKDLFPAGQKIFTSFGWMASLTISKTVHLLFSYSQMRVKDRSKKRKPSKTNSIILGKTCEPPQNVKLDAIFLMHFRGVSYKKFNCFFKIFHQG